MGIFHKKSGFTLAETLITLVTLGIVAAVTLPILNQNINNKAFSESKGVFDKKLYEAMNQMRVADKMSGFSTNQAFLDEFQNYMKTVRTCDNSNLTDCFSSKIYATDGSEVDVADKLKTGKDFGKDTNTEPLVGAMFANGTSAILAYDPSCVPQSPFETGDPTSCLSILYDVNGFKKPNKSGVDIKQYHVDKLGSACAININGTCYGAPFIANTDNLTQAECLAKRDSLGITNCETYDGDYWAAAVETCGHVNNMPSAEDLKTLVDTLYPDGSWSDATNLTGTRDNLAVDAMGFDSGISFTIWSGTEISAMYSTYVIFYDDMVRVRDGSRMSDFREPYVICKQ